MRFHDMARRTFPAPARGLAVTGLIVAVAAVTACSSGSSSSSSSSAPASSAPAASAPAASAPASSAPAAAGGSATAQITANWEAFFNSSTPNSKRVQLLQNGQDFASTVQSFSSSPLASAVSAKVDSVKVTSSTQATVIYDLTAAGQTVAKSATGNSVLQNGIWKVGDASFCGLLKQGGSLLNIKLPAACNSAG